MNIKKSYIGIFIFLLVSAYIVFIVKGGTDDKVKINWLTIEEAQKLAAKEPRKIMVDVYTDWCGYCKKMDKEAFRDPQIVEYVNANYYAVKLDAESNKKVDYRGKKLSYADIAFNVFHVQAYPTLIFMDSDFARPVASEGYHTAAKLDEVLKDFKGR